MDELDLLKKDWKRNENSFNQVSDKEIYSMIHKKSSSIVKWILIISILEVLLWTALGMLPLSDEYVEQNYPLFAQVSNLFTYFNYTVILFFIYLFYRNYVAISTTASTKKLMDDIIRTRKTVKYYVWYNLTMIVLMFITGLIMAFICNPHVDEFRAQIQNDNASLAILLLLLLLIVAVFAFLFWLFYRLLYGILLKRLLSNYKELKKIDL